jgi:hypothetical protein
MSDDFDFLADDSGEVTDFLAVEIEAFEEDWRCQECRHPLSAHSRGMIVHDTCLIAGCDCIQAVLTKSAARKVRGGILP